MITVNSAWADNEVSRLVLKTGRVVCRVFLENSDEYGYKRYGYSGEGCEGHGVTQERINELFNEIRRYEYKSAVVWLRPNKSADQDAATSDRPNS